MNVPIAATLETRHCQVVFAGTLALFDHPAAGNTWSAAGRRFARE